MASTVAIAGASGFVGQALCRALADDHHVIGLGRSGAPPDTGAHEWRTCDLFSLHQLEQELQGVDTAIYLVHSMLPSARLTQGGFADLDLLLADNFARAAERAGIRRILYVGGFVPSAGALSPHLKSRFEVERTLSSRTPELTSLRCGIIIGPNSSSFWILRNLVRRLPFMLLPRWTESRTQPIALADLTRATCHAIAVSTTASASFDLGGPDIMTYRELMGRVARIMGRRRWMVGTRFFSPRFSRLWVTLFGSAPKALVAPLLESLRHDMVAQANPLQEWMLPGTVPLDDAIKAALDGPQSSRRPPLLGRKQTIRRQLHQDRRARSVQRLPLPDGADAVWAAQEYLRFLPRFANAWIRVETDPDGSCRFFLAGTRIVLMRLTLSEDRSTPDRQVFFVGGGALVRRGEREPGRLEFRVVEGQLLAAVHDFAPALPWTLYTQTQARVHVHVMNAFGKWLAQVRLPVEPGVLVVAPETVSSLP